MIPGKIVGCEGLEERRLLRLPGFAQHAWPVHHAQRAKVGGTRPGRRLERIGCCSGGGQTQTAIYDPGMGMGEPAPVGVVQANFSQGGGPGGDAGHLRPPGHAARSGGGPSRRTSATTTLIRPKSGAVPPPPHPRPPLRLVGPGRREEGREGLEEGRGPRLDRLRPEMGISSNAPVEELPASTVFGKKGALSRPDQPLPLGR